MSRQTVLPRWRGFNLEMGLREDGRYLDEDFAMIAELGFDFVRLPVRYDRWTKNGDPFAVDESGMEWLDEGILLGEKYGLHVCLNMHRAPGFSVSGFEGEPFMLFQDDEAARCFALHWEMLAKRYRSRRNLSFNLLNEPRWVSQTRHSAVMRAVVGRIRAIDGERLILLDGVGTGNDFPTELVDLAAQNVAFSTRGYTPLGLTHYNATWGHHRQYETTLPVWPNQRSRISSTDLYDGLWDQKRLEGKYEAWAAIAEATRCGVLCGECGCYRETPHGVALAWMNDLLDALTQRNIGYALWNFRGPFGILDSERKDAEYRDFHGHALDVRMLEVLRAH